MLRTVLSVSSVSTTKLVFLYHIFSSFFFPLPQGPHRILNCNLSCYLCCFCFLSCDCWLCFWCLLFNFYKSISHHPGEPLNGWRWSPVELFTLGWTEIDHSWWYLFKKQFLIAKKTPNHPKTVHPNSHGPDMQQHNFPYPAAPFIYVLV